MTSVVFFVAIIIHHSVIGYTSTYNNANVFSCVYLPQLFVDLDNVCQAQYECWDSQLRDYSRYSLFKQFGIHRSNVATATCDYCDNAHYSNMFLMYYHWYLEYMAIHLSKKFSCPFLNIRGKSAGENHTVPFILNHSPADLPEIHWPSLEPNFQGYQYHFAGFTFKLNKRNTHHTILQKVSKHILNDNKQLNLFHAWNTSGHYTLASATLFGCTLIHFGHVTGRTTLHEDVSDESVGYFACVFATKGQLVSQQGDLNAVSCLENNGVLQHWNDVFLCAQRRTSGEHLHGTPCQIYYNTKAIRRRIRRSKLCPGTSSNSWLKVEAPHEHGRSIRVYFSDNDVVTVDVTPKEVHANLTLKATPLIHFQTSTTTLSTTSSNQNGQIRWLHSLETAAAGVSYVQLTTLDLNFMGGSENTSDSLLSDTKNSTSATTSALHSDGMRSTTAPSTLLKYENGVGQTQGKSDLSSTVQLEHVSTAGSTHLSASNLKTSSTKSTIELEPINSENPLQSNQHGQTRWLQSLEKTTFYVKPTTLVLNLMEINRNASDSLLSVTVTESSSTENSTSATTSVLHRDTMRSATAPSTLLKYESGVGQTQGKSELSSTVQFEHVSTAGPIHSSASKLKTSSTTSPTELEPINSENPLQSNQHGQTRWLHSLETAAPHVEPTTSVLNLMEMNGDASDFLLSVTVTESSSTENSTSETTLALHRGSMRSATAPSTLLKYKSGVGQTQGKSDLSSTDVQLGYVSTAEPIHFSASNLKTSSSTSPTELEPINSENPLQSNQHGQTRWLHSSETAAPHVEPTTSVLNLMEMNGDASDSLLSVTVTESSSIENSTSATTSALHRGSMRSAIPSSTFLKYESGVGQKQGKSDLSSTVQLEHVSTAGPLHLSASNLTTSSTKSSVELEPNSDNPLQSNQHGQTRWLQSLETTASYIEPTTLVLNLMEINRNASDSLLSVTVTESSSTENSTSATTSALHRDSTRSATAPSTLLKRESGAATVQFEHVETAGPIHSLVFIMKTSSTTSTPRNEFDRNNSLSIMEQKFPSTKSSMRYTPPSTLFSNAPEKEKVRKVERIYSPPERGKLKGESKSEMQTRPPSEDGGNSKKSSREAYGEKGQTKRMQLLAVTKKNSIRSTRRPRRPRFNLRKLFERSSRGRRERLERQQPRAIRPVVHQVITIYGGQQYGLLEGNCTEPNWFLEWVDEFSTIEFLLLTGPMLFILFCVLLRTHE